MFDPVMGVGKTPQVTQDIVTTQFNLLTEDVTSITSVNLTETGGVGAITGSPINMVTANFDYANQIAMHIDKRTGYVIFDIGRSLVIRSTELYFNATKFAGSSSTMSLSISDDNVTYNTLYSKSFAAAGGAVEYVTAQLGTQKYRYLKLNFDTSNNAYQDYFVLRIKIDSNQYYNK